MPQLYNLFIDRILVQREVQSFFLIIVGYVILFMINCMGAIGGRIILNKLRNTLEYKLRKQALVSFIYPNRNRIHSKDIGELKLKMDNDISKLSEFLQEQFGNFEVKFVLVVVSAICLVRLNWELALLGFMAIPITLFLDCKISRKENILNEENRQNDSQMTTWLHSVASGWKKIKLLGQEKNQERQFIKFQHKYTIYNAKWINYWVTRELIIPKIKNEFLMEFGVYFIGGIIILQGEMSAGELLVFIVYYHLLTNSTTEISAFQASLQSDMPIYLRAMSWNEEGMKNEDKAMVSSIEKIELKNLSFSYDTDIHSLFENVSEIFEKGDCIFIKGRSGSGKTTLIKLILGLVEIKTGNILINDQEIVNLDFFSYYEKISGSLQNTYLFNTSIKENLLYAAPRATDNELEKACKKAQILEEISELSEGINTIVGEKGTRLSGGQCQRILLARAFLKDADVYVFDEVTSALDKNTARSVLFEIKKLAEEKIVFIISHDEIVEGICNKKVYI